ncbi:MAG: cytidine deaminase [Candidatus Aminicenantia bacterium]
MNKKIEEKLIKQAKKARLKSYAPYSKFKVGASLLTKSGHIFTGTNIENSSFGLTICAERLALFKAVSEGEVTFDTLVVVTESQKPIFPCGACLQVFSEFNLDLKIIAVTLEGKSYKKELSSLLPESFNLEK